MNSSTKKLLEYISNNNFESIFKEFNEDEILKVLNFYECMALAYDLFFKSFDDPQIQDFSIRLFFAIKKYFKDEWKEDWKNEVFLGKLCSIIWKYEEMYNCYISAYEKLNDPPDSLLLLLANCNSVPGKTLITDQKSEEFLQKAITKKITFEAALMMKRLAKEKGDLKKEQYWNSQCLQLENDNIHTDIIIPNALLIQNRR